MMKRAIKSKRKTVTAYQLGAGSEGERRLCGQGLIKAHKDGTYEIFSRESVNGTGETASAGDYVKLGTDGQPYPNDRAFFEANHRLIGEDLYEQFPKPCDAWTAEDGMCDEIRFLTEQCGLVIDPTDDSRYFSAPLWGTILSAARDAVIIFYSITRDTDGSITGADFNFVARDEFDRTYTWL